MDIVGIRYYQKECNLPGRGISIQKLNHKNFSGGKKKEKRLATYSKRLFYGPGGN
jgi:hypothetical protein